MQDHELYRRILGIEAPWYVESVELKLEAGEIHVRLGTRIGAIGRVRNVERHASYTITKRNGSGDTWIRANIRPSCMPSRHEASAATTECAW